MQGNNLFISVIIPFYNDEAFLADAIESVLGQTYKQWELLLVDDGGSEIAKDIAKQYASAFPQRIQYMSHRNRANKGAAATRNVGLRAAKGHWVALLDADDTWLPGKLEKQAALAAKYPECGLICEASEYWYSWNDESKPDTILRVGNGMSGIFDPPELLAALYPFGDGAAPCPCSLLIRKNALEQIGGFEERFTGDLQLYEDQVMLTRMYLLFPSYISTDCNNRYRQRAGSCMSNVHGAGHYHNVRIAYLQHFQSYLETHQLESDLTRRLLHKAWLPYRTDLKSRLHLLVNKTMTYLSR